MVLPEIKPEDVLLSITKNCEPLIKQTHKKPQETLECKLIKPKETISFKPLLSIAGSCLLRFAGLEV